MPNDTQKFSEKSNLHPRNKHRDRYDFDQLISICPELANFVFVNDFNEKSIDFANPDAVKILNKAILRHFYHIQFWDIPANYLCPPIPGRADYIHYMADLLAENNNGVIPKGKRIKCLDIGVGANCVYPILGHQEYGWNFVGTDTDSLAIKSANNIVSANNDLKNAIVCRLQLSSKQFFEDVIKPKETFDITVCNPPFHASIEEANEDTLRKVSNLRGEKVKNVILNFGGQPNELWCEGGEAKFIKMMILESAEIPKTCLWFSSLVAKKESLPTIYKVLEQVKATEVKTIKMAQGQKNSRIVAWTFITKDEQIQWQTQHWNKN